MFGLELVSSLFSKGNFSQDEVDDKLVNTLSLTAFARKTSYLVNTIEN